MSARYLSAALLLGLSHLAVSQPVLAADCDVAIELGEKPAMDAYADYSDFLVAIMDYKARDRELRAQQDACPELFVERIDPESLDPAVTYGPETIESALKRAERLQSRSADQLPRITDRSTSRSFRLPVLASTQMENETIQTPLRTLVDGNLSERDQQLVLSLQGPLADDDGAWGSEAIARATYSTLFERERESEIAFALTDYAFDSTLTVSSPNGSYLSVYFQGTDIVLMRIFQVACLGPC